MGFWRLYSPDQINSPIITGEHDLLLSMAAIFLAILAAMVLLPVTDRYHAFKNRLRLLWLGAGSVAMGLGIWAMFFTNILAMKLPFAVSFDIPLTLLSIIRPILASGSCIILFVSAGVSTLRLHQASILLALGVGTMHYIGMEAMIVPTDMYYIPSLFVLSILTAYAFVMVGLNVKIMLSRNRYLGTLIGSTVLGLAVNSTQFVALHATYFVANNKTALMENQAPDTHFLLLGTIAGVTLLLFLLIIAGSKVDRHLREMADSLKKSEIRFQRLAETTPTAIFTFNRAGLTYANGALSDITQHSAETIASLTLEELLGEDFQHFANKVLAEDNPQQHTFNEQIKCQTREGEKRWLHITATRVDIDEERLCLASACDISKQKEAEQSLHQLAYTDPLTALNNRASFMEALSTFLDSRKAATERESCVLLLDLDNFNRYNDMLGYAMGDQILRELARRMRDLDQDVYLTARLNGDEFAILYKGCGDCCNIEKQAQHLYNTLSEPITVGEHAIELGLSIGISSLKSLHHKTPDLILHEADIALHRAKLEGKSRWVLYDDEIDATVKRARILQAELRKAIKDGKLALFYQPIVDANHHLLRGFEGLSRWQRKNGEWVSPGEFIPLAEKSGMIVELELWALKTAIIQIDQWNRQNPDSVFYVSINLTMDTIEDERLYTLLNQCMADYEVHQHQLKLELTERLLIDDHSDILSRLDTLIGLGCELMIDDFGTGYSSLSYLHRLPVKTLKIDRCFVMNLGKNDNSQHVLNAIITLAKSMRLKLIAEGVETLEQSLQLQDLGADLLQGYLFNRPLAAKDAGREVEQASKNTSLANNSLLLQDLGLIEGLALKH